MKKLFLTLFAAAVCLMACGPKTTYKYPFQNPSLKMEQRIDNLLSLLTPEEKIGLLMNKSISVDSLGIPAYNWWSEACHGIRADGYTVYPQPIGMAAAFDPEQVYKVYSTVSDEARANWNRSQREWNVDDQARYYPGNPELSFWCPNINIFRDPRWGRGQETPGEDPYLTSVIGLQTVLGMQQKTGKYYKTHACAKHYAVHSGPEPLRHSMDVSVSMRDLWETYLPAFKTLVVEGDVREVMGAYQRYEGVPCTMSDRLLVDILRDKWGYDGLVVTDCDAINNYFNRGQHMTHQDPVHAAADALKHGTDLECGRTFRNLGDALEQGLITVDDLDHALVPVLRGRFELGVFDPDEMSAWKDLKPEVISSEEHHQLAVEAARESMVLLKNNGILPLSKDIKRIAVVGPNADDVDLMNGNYGGTPIDAHKFSILTGIRNAFPNTEVVYDKACELVDEYNTINHMGEFNEGKGMLVQFYNNKEFKGEPAASNYYDAMNFSTFGGYGFADGVNTNEFSARATGKWTAPYTGVLKYVVAGHNGYTLFVNGKPLLIAAADGSLSSPALRDFFAPDAQEVFVEKMFNWLFLAIPAALILYGCFRKRKRVLYSVLAVVLILLAVPFCVSKAQMTQVDWRKAAAEDTASKYYFAAVPYGPFETSPDTYAMPSKQHPFGTDNVGRDVFARMTYGARVSLAVGFLATAIELVLGTMIGLFSGYRGGRVDLAVQRLVEIVICFPTFLLLLILMSIMLDYGTRQSILLVIFVLGMTGWPGLSRLVRGEVLKARQMAYIQSCESLGVPLRRILFKHLY